MITLKINHTLRVVELCENIAKSLKLNDEEIRHLRNSLCHGRYFHDFNQTFYFYDGRKNLSLGAKLTIKEREVYDEIPDDLDYMIDNYDGIETLHQKVRLTHPCKIGLLQLRLQLKC